MNSALAKLFVVLAVVPLISSTVLKAQGTPPYYNVYAGTYAIDAKGVRHSNKEYPRRRPPWMEDQIKALAPDYPYSDRAAHHQGNGFFRLALDLKTGAVVTVMVAKSTGFKTLDDSAVAAFRKWRWKPGKWKEIDIPITFEMASRPRPLPRGAVQLPRR